MPPHVTPRANILGVGVSPIDIARLLEAVETWIARDERQYICVTNTHLVMMCQRDEALRRIHNEAGLCTPDGVPLFWLARLMGFRGVTRVCGPDITLACLEHGVTRGWKHFLYGAPPGVAKRMAERMRARFPGVQIVGAYSPPFRPLTSDEEDEVVRMINTSGAHVLWLAIAPGQMERFMARHADRLQVNVQAGIGAVFDFLSGNKPQAPRWIATLGMEWFFRLCTEPRRLFWRYLTNNPAFVYRVLLQGLGRRPKPL